MWMRIATSGITSNRQKPNMIHLLRIAARARRRSKSVDAKGFATLGAGLLSGEEMLASILALVCFFDPLHDQVGCHVDAAGDHEQHDSQHKQHSIMIVPKRSFTHFGRNRRSDRSD